MSAAFQALAGVLSGDALLEGGPPVGGVLPDATATPTTVEEVVELLRVAAASGFGVVPVGGGTDLGPVPPASPFVVLSTRGTTGILDYEPADLTLSARCGTTLGEIERVTGDQGQWLPFDPAHAPLRTLGGMVATGTRGSLAAAYGPPRDHILGLTLVTGDGRVLRLGGRVMKNVAGFDLVRLAVGSRGTLGVVVSANDRLFPRPARDLALVLHDDALDHLVAAARAVATAPVMPASAVLASGGLSVGDGPVLVVRLHGAPESVAADAAHVQAHVGRPFQAMENGAATALFTELRDHAATEALVVRVSALPAALGEVMAAMAATPGIVRFAADTMACRVRVAAETASVEVLADLRATARRLGGSCVVERAPADIVGDTHAEDGSSGAAALSTGLKARFDPQGVLSPGRFVA